MESLITIIDALGDSFLLDLCSLNTVDYIPLKVGGTLIINELHEDVPPISCRNNMCFELADYQIIVVSKTNSKFDYICYMCEDCLNNLEEVGRIEIPYEIKH